MATQPPGLAPIYLPGTEPQLASFTDEEKEQMKQMLKWQKIGGDFMFYCPTKVLMAGGMGFGLGGFVAMMSATFAYEDPLARASQKLTGTKAQAVFMMKELGRNMWSSGKGFAKVGALYSGVECCIEGYRAKNDIWNGLSAGFVSGVILAKNAGPVAAFWGGMGFAGFSGAIDWYMRKPPADDE